MSFLFTDFFALLGINVVVCAVIAHLPDFSRLGATKSKWLMLACFVLLWFPVGAASLPMVAYVRGVSSDLSVSLVVLAALGLRQKLFQKNIFATGDKFSVSALAAASSILLYPLALGLGDWDPYRLGWGSWGMLLGLEVLSLGCWVKGLRLPPLLIALALLAWAVGLLESTNLWDYLLDPWLALLGCYHCIKMFVSNLRLRARVVGRTGA